MSDDRLHTLEERFAWLERQATERDLEMVALHERIRKLERLVETLKEKGERAAPEGAPLPEIERPPHY